MSKTWLASFCLLSCTFSIACLASEESGLSELEKSCSERFCSIPKGALVAIPISYAQDLAKKYRSDSGPLYAAIGPFGGVNNFFSGKYLVDHSRNIVVSSYQEIKSGFSYEKEAKKENRMYIIPAPLAKFLWLLMPSFKKGVSGFKIGLNQALMMQIPQDEESAVSAIGQDPIVDFKIPLSPDVANLLLKCNEGTQPLPVDSQEFSMSSDKLWQSFDELLALWPALHGEFAYQAGFWEQAGKHLEHLRTALHVAKVGVRAIALVVEGVVKWLMHQLVPRSGFAFGDGLGNTIANMPIDKQNEIAKAAGIDPQILNTALASIRTPTS